MYLFLIYSGEHFKVSVVIKVYLYNNYVILKNNLGLCWNNC